LAIEQQLSVLDVPSPSILSSGQHHHLALRLLYSLPGKKVNETIICLKVIVVAEVQVAFVLDLIFVLVIV
jgi:hypothetical protein